jgi:hypothetical protein
MTVVEKLERIHASIQVKLAQQGMPTDRETLEEPVAQGDHTLRLLRRPMDGGDLYDCRPRNAGSGTGEAGTLPGA